MKAKQKSGGGFCGSLNSKQLTKEKVNYFIVQPNQQLKLTERAHCKIHCAQRFCFNLKLSTMNLFRLVQVESLQCRSLAAIR
jgi:hypothetical protein